jgi:hypothetical protein
MKNQMMILVNINQIMLIEKTKAAMMKIINHQMAIMDRIRRIARTSLMIMSLTTTLEEKGAQMLSVVE